MGLRFQDPLWLLLLIPVLALGLWAARKRRRTAILYSDTGLLRSLPATWALRVKRLLPWMKLLGMAMVVAALARPQHGREEFRLRTEGVAIEMCIDHSGSMQALDFQLDGQRVDRLAVVKRVFRDFVAGNGRLPGRPDDLIGLVDFGGFAEAKCPLTLDHGALLQVLDTIKIPELMRDAEGRPLDADLWQEDQQTALGDAVVLAVDRFKNVKATSRVIILLTDGKQTAGVIEPADAAKAAKTYGIKIYSIGIGTNGEAPFPQVDAFGRTRLVPVPVEMDEPTLRMLAEETGGRYFNAQDTAALEQVYAAINRLEKSPSEGRLYLEYREWYQYLMIPGLALIVLELVLACTRFRGLP